MHAASSLREVATAQIRNILPGGVGPSMRGDAARVPVRGRGSPLRVPRPVPVAGRCALDAAVLCGRTSLACAACTVPERDRGGSPRRVRLMRFREFASAPGEMPITGDRANVSYSAWCRAKTRWSGAGSSKVGLCTYNYVSTNRYMYTSCLPLSVSSCACT